MPENKPEYVQLDMNFNRFDSLPELMLPKGYSLSTLQERSDDDWIEALNATGELGVWDRKRAAETLKSERHPIREGTFIVMFAGEPVATACVVVPTPAEKRPEMGWVSASPEHQGKGLGFQVSVAALHFMKQLGYLETFLHTDDFRLPAIKTYLKLGFEPQIIHDSHPGRWKAVLERLSR